MEGGLGERMDATGLDTVGRGELSYVLRDCRETIIDDWRAAIAGTSFTPLSSAEVRRQLEKLTDQAIFLLLSETFDLEQAREIGASLASMHYLSPEVIGRTQEILARHFHEAIPAAYAAMTQARVATLLAEIGVGFVERARDTVLREQEEIKGALLNEYKRTAEALRRSEASLAEAQQIAHVGHWDYDWERDTLFWSEEIFRIFGVTKDEFGSTFEDFFRFVHPEDMGLLVQAGGAALGGGPISTEHRIIRPDAEVRTVQQRLRFIFDESQPPVEPGADRSGDGEETSPAKQYLNGILHMANQGNGRRLVGKPVRVVGTVQDITERKRAEEEVRKARDELDLRVQERTAELAQINEELRMEIARRMRSEEAQSILIEAGAVLSSSLDYRATLSDVASLVVPRLADWAAVDVLGDDGLLKRVAIAHTDPEKIAWARRLQAEYPSDPDSSQGAYQVVRTGRAEFYPDISDEMLVSLARDEEHLRLMRELGFTSAILVPLAARGRTLGVITLVSAESEHVYGHADLELARELARHAALAVDNARLYEEARGEIAERRRAEEALRSSRNELEIVLQGVTDGIIAQDPTGRMVYANEAAAKILGYPSTQALIESSPAQVMRRFEILDEFGQPVLPEDLPVRKALRGEQSHEMLLCYREVGSGKERWSRLKAAPVLGEQGRVLLAVNIFRDVTEGRRTEETMREMRKAERARIARDLHDRALQDLSYAVAEAQITQRLSQDPGVDERLKSVIEAMQRAGRALRSAVYDLRQEGGGERSFVRLVESLIGLSRQMSPKRKVVLRVADGFPGKLPEPASRELLSIMQEALTNIRRHSDARNVSVFLGTKGDELVLEVRDDGRGFGASTPSGIGLESMRERAASLDGMLELKSEPGKGTVVRVHVPMRGLRETLPESERGARTAASSSPEPARES